MFWLNILVGIIAGAITLIVLVFLVGKNNIAVRVLTITVMIVFVQISIIYFSPYFLAWKTIYQIKQIPFYQTIQQSDPLLFDQFITKINDDAMAKGSINNIVKYSNDLDNIILNKYLGTASDDAIYNYLRADVNVYEALYKIDPAIILKLEEKTHPDSYEINGLNRIDQQLFNNLLESSNQIVISAVTDPQAPSDSSDAADRENKVVTTLSKKYGQETVSSIFSNSGNSSLNPKVAAGVVIDVYKILLASGKENVGIIMRALYGNTTNSTVQSLGLNVAISKAQYVYQKVSDAIYTVYSEKSLNAKYGVLGSGVAIDKNILATNCHVALSEKYMVVRIEDQLSPAKLYYQNGDMCLIQIAKAHFIPVKIRQSKAVNIGEEVFAIGNPEGYERTISRGIISNKYTSADGQYVILQTDAAISQGSSGGGLFDVNGSLIGITTAISRAGSNIGFVIPTEMIINRGVSPIKSAALNPKVNNSSDSILSYSHN